MISPRALTNAGVVAVCSLLILLASAAHAADPTLSIKGSQVAPDGSVKVVVAVSGLADGAALTADDIEVTDSGGTVEDLRISPLTATARALSVALVIDSSGSTAGRPIADAKKGADGFLSGLPKGTTVSVISFGSTASVIRKPTTNIGAARAAVSRIDAGGSTALYDALALAGRTLGTMPGQRNAIVFSDGRDTVSKTTAAAGLSALKKSKAATTVVGLRTPDYDSKTLGSIAKATDGSVVEVGGSAALSGAFATVAKDLSSQYSVTYSVARSTAAEFQVRVGLAGTAASDAVTLLAPASAIREAPRPALSAPQAAPAPLIGRFASPLGLFVGLAAAFAAALLVFGPVILPSPDRGARRWLRRAMRRPKPTEPEHPDVGRAITDVVGRTAVTLIGRLPGTRAGVEKLQLALVRSGWPLRATEFRAIQVGAILTGSVIGLVAFSGWYLALAFALLGALIPRMVLKHRLERRSRAFLKQLPQALDILASSLQAGLSFMQALDGLVKELDDPAATEFGRVISEARLGMPLDESLEAAADRIGAEDFSWVVMAVVIQRRTGGNLSQLMRTVAATLRERDQIRAQIKVLSAEGRLSAAILIALPFVLAGYLMLVNPGYINKLFTVPIGQLMAGGALMMMGVGIYWMRKIVRIDI